VTAHVDELTGRRIDASIYLRAEGLVDHSDDGKGNQPDG
jgi:hypothetical protein